jgi:hypothetical protein
MYELTISAGVLLMHDSKPIPVGLLLMHDSEAGGQ